MSYILEALKKADQERNRGAVPDLAAEHAGPVSAVPRRHRGWWLVGGLVLVNLLLVAGYLRDTTPEPGQRVAAAIPSQAVSSQPPTQAAPVPGPAAREDAPATVATPEPRILLQPPGTSVRQEPAVSPPPRGTVTTLAVEPPGEREVYAITPWQQASADAQRLASGLSLDVHVFSDRPAQRFVLINMTKYREGDELREGALLERITAQGVVLSYRGERFRYDKP